MGVRKLEENVVSIEEQSKKVEKLEGPKKIKLKASDYLYERKGPWPQPSPTHPVGESAAVLHLPISEWVEWWFYIGFRFIMTLLKTPSIYGQYWKNTGLKHVTDKEFYQYMTKSCFAKFITPKLDEKDKETFKNYIDKENDYFIIDLSAVSVVHPLPGIHLSATKTLLKQVSENEFEIKCIWIQKTDAVLEPEDGDAWELAKYFVLQGSSLCATLVIHPLLHFPMDSINAVTKTALPKDHVLFKLLYPHLRFTLALENAVLTFKSSLVMNRGWMGYAPFPGSEGLRDLLVQGYKGIDGNDSYPSYSYPKRPQRVFSTYGDFQDRYFDVVKSYVEKVLSNIGDYDDYIFEWAKGIAGFVPGFPNEQEIFEGDNLINAVSYYIWVCSVGHAIDHHSFGHMDIQKVPFRIRQAPPVKNIELKDKSKLCNMIDLGKYKMAQTLFFRPNNVTLLKDVKYNFSNPKLQAYAEEFMANLKKLDVDLEKEGIRYMPLDEIAASVQY